jgi:hypothetical protein
MNSPSRYEIFQKLPAKHPTWVETAFSLNDAKMRLKELAIMFPADYFIFDAANACFVVPYGLGKAGDATEGQPSGVGAGSGC